jgi:hypothetical protein
MLRYGSLASLMKRSESGVELRGQVVSVEHCRNNDDRSYPFLELFFELWSPPSLAHGWPCKMASCRINGRLQCRLWRCHRTSRALPTVSSGGRNGR